MEKIKQRVVTVLEFIMGLLLLAMIVSNFIQMVTRYFINMTVVWVEDFSILGIYWCFALGMPLAWLLNAHMEMNILENVLSAKVKVVISYLVQLSGIIFGSLFIKAGLRAIKLNKGYIMSIIGFDEMWRYVPLVVCGVLLILSALFTVTEMVLKHKALKNEKKG
mgnify:CR=1 FL=1